MKLKQAYCRKWQVTVNDEPSGRSVRDSYTQKRTLLTKTDKSLAMLHKNNNNGTNCEPSVTLGQQYHTLSYNSDVFFW